MKRLTSILLIAVSALCISACLPSQQGTATYTLMLTQTSRNVNASGDILSLANQLESGMNSLAVVHNRTWQKDWEGDDEDSALAYEDYIAKNSYLKVIEAVDNLVNEIKAGIPPEGLHSGSFTISYDVALYRGTTVLAKTTYNLSYSEKN